MAPWLRTYRSYQGRECSTRPCHGSGYAHSALEHSQLTYGNAIRMSGMQLLRCWYCAIPRLVRPPLDPPLTVYCSSLRAIVVGGRSLSRAQLFCPPRRLGTRGCTFRDLQLNHQASRMPVTLGYWKIRGVSNCLSLVYWQGGMNSDGSWCYRYVIKLAN